MERALRVASKTGQPVQRFEMNREGKNRRALIAPKEAALALTTVALNSFLMASESLALARAWFWRPHYV